MINKTQNFIPEDYFFVFDSESLDSVRERAYGYMIRDGVIYEGTKKGDDIDSFVGGNMGAYVALKLVDDDIVITQDNFGAFGIYIYENDFYFAVSNSLYLLADHVKRTHTLSINRDYCYAYAVLGQSTFAFTQTIYNEIKMLPRNTILHINKAGRTYRIEKTDLRERTVPINSKEAIDILDGWIYRWSSFFYSAVEQDVKIMADLTGGYDSRLSVLPLLVSGADLRGVHFNSNESAKADLKVAEEIGKKYGFAVNENGANEKIPFSLYDTLMASFIAKLGCFNLTYPIPGRRLKKTIHINGYAGEIIYDRWNKSFHRFVFEKSLESIRAPFRLRFKVLKAIKKMLNESAKEMDAWYGKASKRSNINSLRMFTDVRTRLHFGRHMVTNYINNRFSVNPILDPELLKIDFIVKGVDSQYLLPALIYERFCPELALIRFNNNKGKGYDETIRRYVKNISDKYPYEKKTLEPKNVIELREDRELDNESVEQGDFNSVVKNAFLTEKVCNLISDFSFKGLYDILVMDVKLREHIDYPVMSAVCGLGIAKACNDINISNGNSSEELDWIQLSKEKQCDFDSMIDRIKKKNRLYLIFKKYVRHIS